MPDPGREEHKSMKKLSALASVAFIIAAPAILAAPAKKKPADLWVCPMQGAVIKSHADAGKGPVVNGRVIHFCCAGCQPEFNKLTAKEKGIKVAAAVKKEASSKKKQ
jgi:hypothetical protein